MKIYKLLLISILPITFIGCATSNQSNNLEKKHVQSLQEKKIEAFTKVSKSEKSLIIPVPAPDNIISRKIMLARIKAGVTSNAIDSLVELLKLDAETPI
ncbi:MAG TPA: hypothetical protein VFX01_06600, partial [Methylophilaceae bacterium]|nr:hypothetical protein [Methylophilaceae bacterium]